MEYIKKFFSQIGNEYSREELTWAETIIGATAALLCVLTIFIIGFVGVAAIIVYS